MNIPRAAALLLLAPVLLVAGCAGGASSPQATVTVAAPAVTVTAPAPTPTTPQPTEEPADPPADPQPAATPAVEAAEATFVMPAVVGHNLQDSQDLLQSLGSYVMDQQDASGLGRMQILDSNWKVCTQSPAAGTKVPLSTVVVLASVKLSETCP